MVVSLLSVLCNINSYQQVRKEGGRVRSDKDRKLKLVEERYPSNITLAKAVIKSTGFTLVQDRNTLNLECCNYQLIVGSKDLN